MRKSKSVACCWAARSLVSTWKAIVARILPPVTMIRLMPISTSVETGSAAGSGRACRRAAGTSTSSYASLSPG